MRGCNHPQWSMIVFNHVKIFINHLKKVCLVMVSWYSIPSFTTSVKQSSDEFWLQIQIFRAITNLFCITNGDGETVITETVSQMHEKRKNRRQKIWSYCLFWIACTDSCVFSYITLFKFVHSIGGQIEIWPNYRGKSL